MPTISGSLLLKRRADRGSCNVRANGGNSERRTLPGGIAFTRYITPTHNTVAAPVSGRPRSKQRAFFVSAQIVLTTLRFGSFPRIAAAPHPPKRWKGRSTSDGIRFADVNGVRLAYEVRAESSEKPVAVFAHGYTGRSTGGELYGDLLGLLEEEFTIFAVDLRGHGLSASEGIEDWSMSAVADDVAAFTRALGLEKPLLIGHSFGGFTGMYCEVRHPGTFGALCLITPGSAEGAKDTPPELERLWIDHGNDREFLLGALADNDQALYQDYPTAHIDAVLLMDRRVHLAYFGEYRTRIIIDELAGIRIPVLMLNGALDNVVPLPTQHASALAIPNCKEVVFTTEGHLLPLESPARVAREIVAFWRHDCKSRA